MGLMAAASLGARLRALLSKMTWGLGYWSLPRCAILRPCLCGYCSALLCQLRSWLCQSWAHSAHHQHMLRCQHHHQHPHA